MTLRPIALLAVLLLAACSSDKPKPAPTPQASRSVTMVEPVLPAHLRELSGTLSSIQGSLPRGSEVQMALLVIDERDRPQRLLASETVLATGELMPFRLPFNPESFPPAMQTRPRACLTMKLMSSVRTHSAAMIRSPSFSRSSSSIRMTILPWRMSSISSSIVLSAMGTPLCNSWVT